jgi:hypothetical protein
MEQPVIVAVAAAEPADDTAPSADFAAGAAAVVAAAAADVAGDAATTADFALAQAEGAVMDAVRADEVADDAHDRIDRIEEFLEDLIVVLNDGLPPAAAADLPEPPDDGAPEPAAPMTDPEPPADPGKPKRQRSGKWGADGWFGSRD